MLYQKRLSGYINHCPSTVTMIELMSYAPTELGEVE